MIPKKILIPPEFRTISGLNRIFYTATISDFLYANGANPTTILIPGYQIEDEKVDDLVLEAMHQVDGVILQGGNDIDPTLYSEKNTGSIDIKSYRDQFETKIIKQALVRKIPIFGICRGFQLINVSCNGTLHQDLKSPPWNIHILKQDEINIDKKYSKIKRSSRPRFMKLVEDLNHPVRLEKGGLLEQIIKQDIISVHSFHHQGIDQLGKGLKIEATSSDGLIEAFSDSSRGIIGVQWHPEKNFSLSYYSEPLLFWLNEYVGNL